MNTTQRAVGALALAAQQAALLRGALASGFLTHLTAEIGVAELAGATGLEVGRVRALCAALGASGVLDRGAADRYRLSGTYASLLPDGQGTQYLDQLRNAAVRERLYEQMFRPEGPDRYADLSRADRT